MNTDNTENSGKWSKEEDDLLEKSILLSGKQDWKKVAEKVPGRSSIQCLHRWSQILRPGIKRCPWSKEEDAELLKWVQANGDKKWYEAAHFLKGRTPKQCKERWCNRLDPEIKKDDWSFCEDEILFSYYKEFGPLWSKVPEVLPGRTENAAKKRFSINVMKLAGGEIGSDSIAKALREFEKISAELKFENQKGLKKSNFPVLKNDLFFENFLAQQGDAISLQSQQEYDEFKELDTIQNSILLFCQKNIFPTFQVVSQGVESPQEKTIKQKKVQRIRPPRNIGKTDSSEGCYQQSIENITISMPIQDYMANDKENIKGQSDTNEENSSQIHTLLGQLSSLEGLLKTAKNHLFELKNMDNFDQDDEQLKKLSEINMKRKLDLEDLSQNLNRELDKMAKKIKN